MNYISNNLGYLLRKTGLGKDSFGETVGLKRGNIGSYIDKKAFPKIETLQKIAEVLKLEDLASQNLKKLNMAFKFTNGRVNVNPFNINMSGIKTAIEGSTGFDQTISYQVNMDVPRAKLGAKANEIVEGLLGKVKLPGADLKLPAIIPVNFEIGGTVTNPTIKNNLKLKASNIVTDIKNQVVDTVKKTFNKQIDKIMADAQLQAQKVRDEAKVQADKLRAEGVKLTNQAKAKADEEAIRVFAENLKQLLGTWIAIFDALAPRHP